MMAGKTWTFAAYLSLLFVLKTEALLSLTKQYASSISLQMLPRLQTHLIESVTALRYRSLENGNDTDYRDPTLTFSLQQVPLTLVKDLPTASPRPSLLALEHDSGLKNSPYMDQYLESIYRRYRRLYDYSNGDALKAFSSASSCSFAQRKRRNKIRVFIAFVFQHWSH
jgi:hypothetical protein